MESKMAYKGIDNFSHGQADKVGVLLVNLGTPAAPTTKALRTYLRQFLSDRRVVEIPRLLWMLILHGIILRVRPKKSAEAYQEVWTEQGSPLMSYARAQQQALQQRFGAAVQVELAMRYGQPSVDSVTEKMLSDGVRNLLVLPLYPQYSGPTTASTFDALATEFMQRRWLPNLRFVASYHNYAPYIEALAKSVETFWSTHGRADKLILSFHGVPKQFLTKGDPYHCQCHVTTRLLVTRLGLNEGEYLTTFQSRFGKAEWLKPYTDATLKALPSEGIKHVQMICPGFSSDCLETIEEIEVENRDYFMEAGGETYQYIPALNDQTMHIDALQALIEENLHGWQLPKDNDQVSAERQTRFDQHQFNT
jgi:ferrochelatase